MSIIETLNIFNKTVLSQSNLELEVRFNFIKNKSDFENIYNTLLKYLLIKSFQIHKETSSTLRIRKGNLVIIQI